MVTKTVIFNSVCNPQNSKPTTCTIRFSFIKQLSPPLNHLRQVLYTMTEVCYTEFNMRK